MRAPSSRGFTLIEALIVLSIVAILSALTLAAGNYAITKGETSRAQGEVMAMSAALERYKNENGAYPATTPISGNGTLYTPSALTYIPNSEVLYAALSGMTHGTYGGPATGPVYVEFKISQLNTNSQSVYLVDPFKNSYGFLSAQASGTATNTVLNNPGFFDLWSSAGQDGLNGRTNYSQWIGNWSGQ